MESSHVFPAERKTSPYLYLFSLNWFGQNRGFTSTLSPSSYSDISIFSFTPSICIFPLLSFSFPLPPSSSPDLGSYISIPSSPQLFRKGSCSLFRASHQSSTFLSLYCGTSALTPHPPSPLSLSPSFSHSFSPAKSALAMLPLPLSLSFSLSSSICSLSLSLWPSH